MRVLHINAGNLYGGVETLLVTLARCRALCPAMEPSFALTFEGRLSRELREAGVPVHLLGGVRASRPWTVARARTLLSDLIDKSSFDVVVTHLPWSHAIFASTVRSCGISIVNWMHGVPSRRSWIEAWAGLTPPDLMIANSLYTAKATAWLFGGVKKEVLYLPVASSQRPSDRNSIRQSLGVDPATVVILQVSRMEAWKGHRSHLQALAKLKHLSNWVCWIAGGAQRAEEEQYLADLKKRARDAGIADRIIFLGQRQDVGSLMAASDVFCQPNESAEPFGIVFVEAMQSGLPVVTTDIGGASEIVDSSCGVLMPPDATEALAGSLARLIEDAAWRKKLSEGGPVRARQLCDPATQSGKLRDLLDSLATTRRVHYGAIGQSV